MHTINFDSLKKLTKRRGFIYFDVSILGYFGIPLLIIFGAVLIFFLMLVFVYLPTYIFYILFPGLIIMTIFAAVIQNREYNKAITKFCDDNGWAKSGSSPNVPILLKLDYAARNAILTGELLECKFWLYEARPQSTNKKNELLPNLLIITVKLPKELPELISAPNKGIFRFISDQPFYGYLKLEQLSLEGDFDKFFITYITKDDHIKALEYLTPDILEVMKLHTSNLVLYSGTYLSLATTKGLNADSLQDLFEDMQIVLKEVKEKQRIR